MSVIQKKSAINFVGHPYSSIGVGAQIRSHIRSATKFCIEPNVYDIYRYLSDVDPEHLTLSSGLETSLLEGGIRIFHINGDEVDSVLAQLAERTDEFKAGYNIIVPAWELPVYPQIWVEKLALFDEVWSLSKFIKDGLYKSGIDSYIIGQSVEVKPRQFLSRRYFGIRESAFTILHFFDSTSFADRKNPVAVLDLYRKIKKYRPYENIQLVLKVKSGDRNGGQWLEDFKSDHPDVLFISEVLSSYETDSLINCCDCFASLHRSEGFGRGSGEAMSLGKIALATNWSGNTDFMNEHNSLPVMYELVPVLEGQYPQWENQHWAQPDIDHAAFLLNRILDDSRLRRFIGAAGRSDILKNFGDRAVGIRIANRASDISIRG